MFDCHLFSIAMLDYQMANLASFSNSYIFSQGFPMILLHFPTFFPHFRHGNGRLLDPWGIPLVHLKAQELPTLRLQILDHWRSSVTLETPMIICIIYHIMHGEDENVPTCFCCPSTNTTDDHGHHPWSEGCAVTFRWIPQNGLEIAMKTSTIVGDDGSHSWGIATARARNGSWRFSPDLSSGGRNSPLFEILTPPNTWRPERLQEF